jgi:hypothetical protein
MTPVLVLKRRTPLAEATWKLDMLDRVNKLPKCKPIPQSKELTNLMHCELLRKPKWLVPEIKNWPILLMLMQERKRQQQRALPKLLRTN